MRKSIIAFGIVAVMGGFAYMTSPSNNVCYDLMASDVEALTAKEGMDCGNTTYIPHEALRSATCWNGGTHKKCKKENGVCCNPSEQTDCKGIV